VFHDKQLAGKSAFVRLSVRYFVTACHLVELAVAGIGIHHAGLSMDDRRAIEDLYLKKVLRIVIATSVS
jgi:replicative superfamily II helicase